MMLWSLCWLQLLLGGDKAAIHSLPLRHALQDADTLLTRFGIRETLQLFISPDRAGLLIENLPAVTVLHAPDTLTAVAGIYVLLEEKHGLCFVHPRHVVRTRHLRRWRQLEVSPRFVWRGFHLHTQHPIELTEALHDPHFPQGEQRVREYIDWLIRNRQNYFEFCLLRTVHLARWVPYFKRIVSYARERGVEVGIDLSLRMQQQRAYQLLPRWRPKRQSMRQRLTAIASTGIARLNVELTSAEFVGKAWGRWIDSLLLYAHSLGIEIMTRQHVVPPEAYAVGDFAAEHLPPQITLCVHSVMCYGLQDSLAPVYRCKNFSHLYKTILTEGTRRKVWYYPETAYWVTFDNSVPVWLLSYLRSRLEDILLVEGKVKGHLTFSSGWDVGYWLFDWSVARWSWRYVYDGTAALPFPAEGLVRLFGGDTLEWMRYILFQDSVLVGRNVLSYITPTTPIDEISWRYLPALQPRLPAPPWRVYRQPALYRADWAGALTGMHLALEMWPQWRGDAPSDSLLLLLWKELSDAWDITRLRVAFRYHWLSALLSDRRSPSEKAHIDSLNAYLKQAEKIVAQLPVRYPEMTQARLCRSSGSSCRHPHPSYRFGYLYPAVSLHFWRRELLQIKEGRWSPLFMNLWDIPRIIGLW